MKLKSKDYEILVDRLKNEIQRNKEIIRRCDETGDREGQKAIAKIYIDYHQEIIRFIEKLDEEIDKNG